MVVPHPEAFKLALAGGTFAGQSASRDVSFYTPLLNGGMAISRPDPFLDEMSVFGAQVFVGPIDAPTFVPGSYDFTGFVGQTDGHFVRLAGPQRPLSCRATAAQRRPLKIRAPTTRSPTMMMKTRLLSAALLQAALVLPGAAVAAPLASSSFDADADGWLVKDLPYPQPGSPPVVLGTATPSYSASGGHPGGHLSLLDISANAWYWSAPAKFLGNVGVAYGGQLSYDIAVTGNGFGNPPGFTQEDVILVGAGRTLVHDTGLQIAPTQVLNWNSISVGLTEAGWKLNSLTGPAASAADMQAVLGSLGSLYIRGEYLFGLDDRGRLDNVLLSAVPEPASAWLMLLGAAGLLMRRVRHC